MVTNGNRVSASALVGLSDADVGRRMRCIGVGLEVI